MQSNSDMIWPISFAPLISIFGAPWSSLSPAWHHDLHHRVFKKSSRQTLLLLLWLTFSNKVKQLHGVIQWHAGHTIIKDNSYGSCRLSYSSTCKSWFLLQEYDQSHTSHIFHSSRPFWPYHITRHMLQKQVRRPLICCCKFLRGCYRFLARTFLTYAKTTTWIANFYLPFIRTLFIKSDPTKSGRERHPPATLCN